MAFFHYFLTFFIVISVASANSQPQIQTRIFGGEPTKVSKFPYMAAFRDATSMKKQFLCNAVIISPHYLLIAAQCIQLQTPISEYTYSVGKTKRQGKMRSVLSIKRFIIHDDFIPYYNFTNDIALLETVEPIEFNAKVAPIAIGRSYIDGGVEAVVTGYGRPLGLTQKKLRFLNVETLTNDECKEFFPNTPFYSEKFLCANSREHKNHGISLEDSGAPLVYNNTLIGIGSFMPRTNRNAPDGYTRISDYVDWIQTHVPDNEGVVYV